MRIAAFAAVAVATGWAPQHCAQATETLAPLMRPAGPTPLAQHAVMEAVALAGARIVAVGERGIVLLSDNDGRTWEQAHTPVSVTLTAVQFVDSSHGWAVGHSGVILYTEDRGEHWVKQLDGAGAAQLALSEARSVGTKPALVNAHRLVAEGADKPFLSLSFTDLAHGTVVGAYGLAVHTDDGGKTWQSWSAKVGDVHALHLYAVRQSANAIWVGGEQGFVARSNDGGTTFGPVQTPYKGSFFTLDIATNGTVVLAGLRGNAYRSGDGGASFDAIRLDGPVTITDVRYTATGQWLIANQAGRIFESRDDGMSFTPLVENPVVPLNGIVLGAHGNVIGAGFAGVFPVARLGSGSTQSQKSADASVTGGKQ
ncbi:WD40/YVTN/BNR-like repeat-containing protein [Paraburkholderia fungorum]